MRNRYIVTYDISDDDRRTRVFKTLRGFGDHIQFSVFRCDLSPADRVRMQSALHSLIDHELDQILCFDLGPADGRGDDCVSWIGRRYRSPERSIVVV